jgi:hypothetical protein
MRPRQHRGGAAQGRVRDPTAGHGPAESKRRHIEPIETEGVKEEQIMNFTGTWDVVSSPDFDDDYLRMEVAPYVRLRQGGDRVEGEYHLGLQMGNLDGRLEGDDHIVFSFEGMDEMDAVNGAGTATLKDDGLIFKLMYHLGDDFTFECERRR